YHWLKLAHGATRTSRSGSDGPADAETCSERSSKRETLPSQLRLPRRTVNCLRSPLRRTTTETESPGLCEYRASLKSYRSFTGRPANSTITSPETSPATSAGLPTRIPVRRSPWPLPLLSGLDP